MKMIAIMLLAALMLFAFVACDNTTDEPEVSDVAAAMTGAIDLEVEAGNKTIDASKLQDGLTIAKDGKVTGTVKYYDGNELDSLGFKNNSNYFAAIKFTVAQKDNKDQTIYVKGTATNGVTNYSTDKEWILELDQKTAEKFEVKVGAAPASATESDVKAGFEAATALITLDFSNATFAP